MVVRIHMREPTWMAIAEAPATPLLADLVMIWDKERVYWLGG